jgi:MFS family permease
MSFTDWLVNIALVALVLRQIRWNVIDRRFVVLPLALVSVAVVSYLKSIPTAGNDLVLIAGFVAVGVTFGGLSALATSIKTEAGRAYARARGLAVVLWIAGIGSRIAFVLYTEHGGASTIAHFSTDHHITTSDAWVDALVLMALAEVVTRVGVLVLRSRRALAAERGAKVLAPVRLLEHAGV